MAAGATGELGEGEDDLSTGAVLPACEGAAGSDQRRTVAGPGHHPSVDLCGRRVIVLFCERTKARHVHRNCGKESVVAIALTVMAKEVAGGPVMIGEAALTERVQPTAGRRKSEQVFGWLFLTARNRLIWNEELFYGTIGRAAVYPRVILQKALACNADAVVAYYNYPSGDGEPTLCDGHLTHRVKSLLQEMDVELLNHIVVFPTEVVSMAGRGLLDDTAGRCAPCGWPTTPKGIKRGCLRNPRRSSQGSVQLQVAKVSSFKLPLTRYHSEWLRAQPGRPPAARCARDRDRRPPGPRPGLPGLGAQRESPAP